MGGERRQAARAPVRRRRTAAPGGRAGGRAMKAVFSHLGRFIAARPYLVAGLVVSLLVFSAYGASSIRMETGIETFVDTDSPEGILLDGYTREFGTDLVFLIVESDNVRDPALLRYVDTLGADIADERYVTGTRSLP